MQSQMFPPRERGWSQTRIALPCCAAVSPARAGMVLQGGQRAELLQGFPRASGDGPSR